MTLRLSIPEAQLISKGSIRGWPRDQLNTVITQVKNSIRLEGKPPQLCHARTLCQRLFNQKTLDSAREKTRTKHPIHTQLPNSLQERKALMQMAENGETLTKNQPPDHTEDENP